MSRAFRLGLFIVTGITLLAIGTFLVGERQTLFTRTYRVVTTFKTVAGLMEGAEVRVGGIHAGTVRRIQMPPQPTGDMTVLMDIERSTRAVVRTDSVASIGTEGLLGNKFVEVSFGSEDAPPISPGGGIRSMPAIEFSDLMKKTNDVLGNVQEGAGHISNISAKIDSGQGTMGALVNDKQVYTQLNDATSQAQQGASAFNENMEALKHNFFLRGFFNDRGYEDAAKLGDPLITELPQAPALQSFHFDVKKLFIDAQHAKLKSTSPITDAGRFLERTPFGLAVVVASGGMKGDSTDLQTMLQARAWVIRDYLVKNFKMDDTRVKTMELGKGSEASSDLGTVDVIVYPTSVKPPPAPRKPPAIR